jgi:hypothetical protein
MSASDCSAEYLGDRVSEKKPVRAIDVFVD